MMSRNPIPPRVPPRTPPQANPMPARSGASPAAQSAAPTPPSPTGPVRQPLPAAAKGEVAGEVVARAATYYRMTRYIMALLLLGMGGWFGYDGFKGWPAENAKIRDLNVQMDAAKKDVETQLDSAKKDAALATLARVNADPLTHKPPHSDTDIVFQRVLTFGLPALGLFVLFWALYQSRGAYRLSGDTLSVSGHPSVKLAEITEIDKGLWDRKGIAWVSYKTAAGESGRMRLDDFIFERDATDEIFKRVESYVAGGSANAATEAVA